MTAIGESVQHRLDIVNQFIVCSLWAIAAILYKRPIYCPSTVAARNGFNMLVDTLGNAMRSCVYRSNSAFRTVVEGKHKGSTKHEKLDPKWVPERAKHSGRKIWHEMKGPWRLSPIEHNPKITNLFSRRAFLVTPRWWRSTWRFPITDHSWNVDIHARKSKRGRRANVKSNNSRQISQVK